MAFSELEERTVTRALDAFLRRRRPPPEISSELDIQYRITGQTIEIFELRPDWRDRDRSIEIPSAKVTYVRSRATWTVYLMRRDLRWHGYETERPTDTIEQALRVVDEDRYGCFFG